MWYRLLINGYTWYTNQLYFSSDFKIAESINGGLNKPIYTVSEKDQICRQLNDYQLYGFNIQLKHLNISGIC